MLIEPLPSTARDADGRGYPRPQLRRESWISLNTRSDIGAGFSTVYTMPEDAVRHLQAVDVER